MRHYANSTRFHHPWEFWFSVSVPTSPSSTHLAVCRLSERRLKPVGRIHSLHLILRLGNFLGSALTPPFPGVLELFPSKVSTLTTEMPRVFGVDRRSSWNSYYVIFCSELVPAPKMYMFFALLNIVGEVSSLVERR